MSNGNPVDLERGRVCPLCGKTYTAPPALSRKDNKTEICPICGTREALEAAPLTDAQRAEILQTVERTDKV